MLNVMRRRHALATAHWAMAVAALFVALALVVGVRPRVIVEQSGDLLVSAQTCVLCDGAATAATVAPATDTVIAVAPLLLAIWAIVWLPVVLAADAPRRRIATRPPAPPPRA